MTSELFFSPPLKYYRLISRLQGCTDFDSIPGSAGALLQKPGIQLIAREADNFILPAYPGLIVKDSYWRWPEHDLAGNAIDFFVQVLDLSTTPCASSPALSRRSRGEGKKNHQPPAGVAPRTTPEWSDLAPQSRIHRYDGSLENHHQIRDVRCQCGEKSRPIENLETDAGRRSLTIRARLLSVVPNNAE